MSGLPDNFEAHIARNGDGDPASALEAYLDGALTTEQRTAFEQRLAGDAELRSQVAQQRRIDASLRRSFAMFRAGVGGSSSQQAQQVLSRALKHMNGHGPRMSRVAQAPEVSPTMSQAVPIRFNWRRTLALAAVIALLVGGPALVWWWNLSHGGGPYIPPNQVADGTEPQMPHAQPLDVLYRKEVASGFKAAWLCKDNIELASYYSGKLGQAMIVADAPEGCHWCGLSYLGGVSEKSISMLAKVNDTPVLIVADRTSIQPPTPLMKDPQGLHTYQREIGQLTLYEITPLDKPSFIDRFAQPKK